LTRDAPAKFSIITLTTRRLLAIALYYRQSTRRRVIAPLFEAAFSLDIDAEEQDASCWSPM